MIGLAVRSTETKQAAAPMTRRQYIEAELDAVERSARERKLPYIDYLASQRKQHGTDTVVALLVKHCGPALKMGPDDLRKFVALEMAHQSELAVKSGYNELLSFRYTPGDVLLISSAIQRIVEAATG